MSEAEEVAAIPLVEERLEVGKRQVESGRVEVRGGGSAGGLPGR